MSERERRVLLALLVSGTSSLGAGLLVYALASLPFGQKLDQQFLMGAIALEIIAFTILRAGCKNR